MTLSLNSLTGIRPFGGKMLYGYVTNDTKATIEGADYFNNASGYLQAGDVIMVSGDLDGTPFHTSYIVASITAGVVAITEHAAVTQNVLQVVTSRVTALGTASNHYVVAPIAGEIVGVYGVSNAANGTAPSTIGINVDSVDVATLSFGSSYSAGTQVTDASITAHALSAGEIITIDNNGEGDGTGEAIVTLVISPA